MYKYWLRKFLFLLIVNGLSALTISAMQRPIEYEKEKITFLSDLLCSTVHNKLELITQSNDIYWFLSSKLNIDVSQLWQQAIDSFFGRDEQVLQTRTWPSQFIAKLEAINKKISHAFAVYKRSLSSLQSKLLLSSREDLYRYIPVNRSPIRDKQLIVLPSAFIEIIQAVPTIKNLPIGTIEINEITGEAILDGMQKAILSYFNIASLQARLQAGDTVIFDRPELPLMFLIDTSAQKVMIIAFPTVSQDNFFSEYTVSQQSSFWYRMYCTCFIFLCFASQGLSLYRELFDQESIPILQAKSVALKERQTPITNAFEILELKYIQETDREKAEEEVHNAYIKALLKYHPDKYHGNDAKEKTIALHRARELLISILNQQNN